MFVTKFLFCMIFHFNNCAFWESDQKKRNYIVHAQFGFFLFLICWNMRNKFSQFIQHKNTCQSEILKSIIENKNENKKWKLHHDMCWCNYCWPYTSNAATIFAPVHSLKLHANIWTIKYIHLTSALIVIK